MTFTFNAVELLIVTMNEKHWTLRRSAGHLNNKKTADIVKAFCSKENNAQKYQMSSVTGVVKPVNWPKDSQNYDIYIIGEGMYELVFSSQQAKAKNFRRHCCNMLFPHVQQHLTNKMKEDYQDVITCHDNEMQALEFTNEAYQKKTFEAQ